MTGLNSNIIEKSYKLHNILKKDNRAILNFKINKTTVLPGHFYMLNYNGCQKPFSVYSCSTIDESCVEIEFLIENRGKCSENIINAKQNEYFGLTGPLGNPFKINSKNRYLIIGGGVGTAPVIFLTEFLLEKNIKIDLLLGERTKKSIIYEEKLNYLKSKYYLNFFIYTNDGTYGEEGFVTKDLDKFLNQYEYGSVCICGPEIMMKKAAAKTENEVSDIQICMERYMKCGLGLCGSCVMDETALRICKEGPVFLYEDLKKSAEFGNYHRDKNGVIKKF